MPPPWARNPGFAILIGIEMTDKIKRQGEPQSFAGVFYHRYQGIKRAKKKPEKG